MAGVTGGCTICGCGLAVEHRRGPKRKLCEACRPIRRHEWRTQYGLQYQAEYRARNKPTPLTNCRRCGVGGVRGPARYCSPECRRIATNEANRHYRAARPKVKAVVYLTGSKAGQPKPNRPKKKPCVDCGVFILGGSTRCRSCNQLHKRGRPKQTCKHCGVEYKPKAVDRVHYCSRQCAAQAKKAQPITYVLLAMNTCVVCSRAWVARRSKMVCSRQCELDLGRQREAQKRPMLRVSCACCGAAFDTRDSKRAYCSAPCRRKLSRAKRAKYTHRTGMSNESWARLRFRVLRRDGFMCHICGERTTESGGPTNPRYPHADHVVPVTKGGPSIDLNVRCTCAKCNIEKSDRVPSDSFTYAIAQGEYCVMARLDDDAGVWRFSKAYVPPYLRQGVGVG